MNLYDYITMATRCIASFAGNYKNIMLRDEDAISQVAEGLMVSATTWEPNKGASFNTYLTNKAIWEIHNWINCKNRKNRKKIKTLSLNYTNKEDQQLIDLIVVNDKKEEEECGATDLINKAGLTQKQTSVLTSVYIDGVSETEIAKEMGVTRQAVNQILHSGLKKIKEIIND